MGVGQFGQSIVAKQCALLASLAWLECLEWLAWLLVVLVVYNTQTGCQQTTFQSGWSGCAPNCEKMSDNDRLLERQSVLQGTCA